MIEATIARSVAPTHQFLDERAVDLHEVEGEHPQVGERGVSGAEVVEADLDTGVAQASSSRSWPSSTPPSGPVR